MAKNEPVKAGEAIVIFHKNFGYIRAWAKRDADFSPGSFATFEVTVNSESMPGVSMMEINTNSWSVYKEDDPELGKLLLRDFVKYDSRR